MEIYRIWHEPVVEIYANAVTPGVRSSAEAYDLANRRWYQLNVDSEVDDDSWMSGVVTKHVSAYYDIYHTAPPWNTINTSEDEDSVSFETRPDEFVVRPILQRFDYGAEQTDKLLTIQFNDIKRKIYLSKGVDYCVWNSQRCVFKRIEFDVDVKQFRREIRTRETLIDSMKGEVEAKDYDIEMERRFNIVPIVAVVLHQEQPGRTSPSVAGFLMPFTGDSLEVAARTAPTLSGLHITELQLWDLARGVRELALCGLMHGDIRFWNVIVSGSSSDESATILRQQERLLLIDLGGIAPEYKSDAYALGDLLLWCLKHAPLLKEDKASARRVMIAASILKADEDLERAVELLAPSDEAPLP